MHEPVKVAHLQGAVSPGSRCAYREGKQFGMVWVYKELLVFPFYIKKSCWRLNDYEFTAVVSAERRSDSG